MKTISLIITLTLVASTLGAQQLPAWTGTTDIRYTGKHVFRGAQKTGQALQANIEFNPIGDGFYAGGWFNQPFDDNWDSEFDLFGGYRYDCKGVKLDASLTGYFYPQAKSTETDYSYELALGAGYEVLSGWSISGYTYYDVRLETLTFEASTGYRIPFMLAHLKAAVDASFFIGCSDADDYRPDTPGPNTKDTWAYFGTTVSTTVWFNETLSASAGIQYGTANNRSTVVGGGNARTDKTWGFVGIGLKW